MRMGSGVRFKVLEAMAAGVPVVATPLGMAGLAADHERHALVSRDAAGLAEALARVLQDRPLARDLAQRARLLVEGRYDWKKITPQYLRLLTSARKRRR
jgi:glycosyltransferase involved in cell wall biosynthesis